MTATVALTATRFAWACLGSPAYLPENPAPDSQPCWLCGGPTEGRGWPREQAIPPTFTNVNLAVAPASHALCEACAYFGSSTTWKAYCEANPGKALKSMHPLSWRSYSHAFAADWHDCPTRARWRQWLLEPPQPPFLFCIAESGQKHLLFRARVAYDRDAFPVQVEEDSLWIDRALFGGCLAIFETLYAAGFSKDSIVSGRYHSGQLAKVGLQAWRNAETAMAPWRERFPELLRLAHFCAQREEQMKENEA